MLPNGHNQVACAPIVKEEKALPEAPQRRGSEFVSDGLTLRYPVVQVVSHSMKRQI